MAARAHGIFNQFCRMTRRCLIGLGSNLGNRHALLDDALQALAHRFDTRPVVSSRYETPAWGMAPGTPPFINQAAMLTLPSALAPLEVLDALLEIERTLGRTRSAADAGYQSRSIDLDVLAVEGCCIEEPRLVLPHPRMHLRRFVLEPLNEIAPDFILNERGQTVADLLRTCTDDAAVQRLETTP